MSQIDDAIRTALQPAREATFTNAQAARAMRAAEQPRRKRSRTVALALAFSALLTTTAVAVPTSLFGWLDSGTPPGRELRPDEDVPAWVEGAGARTLVAENGGLRLYAVRNGDDVTFALDRGVAIGDSTDAGATSSTITQW